MLKSRLFLQRLCYSTFSLHLLVSGFVLHIFSLNYRSLTISFDFFPILIGSFLLGLFFLFPFFYIRHLLFILQHHFPDKPLSLLRYRMLILSFGIQLVSGLFYLTIGIMTLHHFNADRIRAAGLWPTGILVLGFFEIVLSVLDILIAFLTRAVRKSIEKKHQLNLLRAFD